MAREAVIDMETLDTAESAVILSIAIVTFDPDTVNTIEELDDESTTFYIHPDVEEQLHCGRTMSFGAIQFWLDQPKSVRDAVFGERIKRQTGWYVCDRIRSFLTAMDVDLLWGYGNMFDNVILRSYYKSLNAEYPLHYRGDLDIRTLERVHRRKIYDLGIERGDLHNAYQDALAEAVAVQMMLNGRVPRP